MNEFESMVKDRDNNVLKVAMVKTSETDGNSERILAVVQSEEADETSHDDEETVEMIHDFVENLNLTKEEDMWSNDSFGDSALLMEDVANRRAQKGELKVERNERVPDNQRNREIKNVASAEEESYSSYEEYTIDDTEQTYEDLSVTEETWNDDEIISSFSVAYKEYHTKQADWDYDSQTKGSQNLGTQTNPILCEDDMFRRVSGESQVAQTTPCDGLNNSEQVQEAPVVEACASYERDESTTMTIRDDCQNSRKDDHGAAGKTENESSARKSILEKGDKMHLQKQEETKQFETTDQSDKITLARSQCIADSSTPRKRSKHVPDDETTFQQILDADTNYSNSNDEALPTPKNPMRVDEKILGTSAENAICSRDVTIEEDLYSPVSNKEKSIAEFQTEMHECAFNLPGEDVFVDDNKSISETDGENTSFVTVETEEEEIHETELANIAQKDTASETENTSTKGNFQTEAPVLQYGSAPEEIEGGDGQLSDIHDDNEEIESGDGQSSDIHDDNEEIESGDEQSSDIHDDNEEIESGNEQSSNIHDDNVEIEGGDGISFTFHETGSILVEGENSKDTSNDDNFDQTHFVIEDDEVEYEEIVDAPVLSEPMKRARYLAEPMKRIGYGRTTASDVRAYREAESRNIQSDFSSNPRSSSLKDTSSEFEEGSAAKPIALEDETSEEDEGRYPIIIEDVQSSGGTTVSPCTEPASQIELGDEEDADDEDEHSQKRDLRACIEAFGYYLDQKQFAEGAELSPYGPNMLQAGLEPPSSSGIYRSVPWTRDPDADGEIIILREDISRVPSSLLGPFLEDDGKLRSVLAKSCPSDDSLSEPSESASIYTDPEKDVPTPLVRKPITTDRLGTSLDIPMGLDESEEDNGVEFSVIAESLGMGGVEDALFDSRNGKSEEKSRKSVSWNEFAQVKSDDPILSGPLKLNKDGGPVRRRPSRKKEKESKCNRLCNLFHEAPFWTKVLIYVSISMLCIAFGIIFTAVLGKNRESNDIGGVPPPSAFPKPPSVAPVAPPPDLIPPKEIIEYASPTASPTTNDAPTLIPTAAIAVDTNNQTNSTAMETPTEAPTTSDLEVRPGTNSSVDNQPTSGVPTPAPVPVRPPFLWG